MPTAILPTPRLTHAPAAEPAQAPAAGPRPSVPGWTSAAVVAAVTLAVDLTVSITRYLRFQTGGFDLGIFVQEVRGWAEHGWPVSDIIAPGYPTLGEHFSPILAVLAPLWWVWPSPIMLLVAQSVLFAVATIPLTRWAADRLGPTLALVLGLALALSTPLMNAAAFDVHEIMFAVPLLAAALTAVGRGRHRAGLVWALPLVLVKEDLGLTVAALACVVALRSPRHRRLALVVGTFGVLATVVEMRWIIPLINQTHQYRFTDAFGAGLTHGWDVKLLTLAVLLVPTAGLALRSPLALVALPTLAWRFCSTNRNYWGPWFHYDAVPAVAIAAAVIDVLCRNAELRRRSWRRFLITWCAAVTAVALLIGSAHARLDSASWPTPVQTAATRSVLAEIPDGASVAASNHVAAQLTVRHTVYLLSDTTFSLGVRPDFLAVDLRACPTRQDCSVLDTAAELGYRPLARDGFAQLWRR